MAKQARSLILCTHGYKTEQVSVLSTILNVKFGLATTVSFNKTQPIIRISAKSYPIVQDLIFDTLMLMPSMKAKFPF